MENPSAEPEPLPSTTRLGTPCAPAWTQHWIDQVNAVECRLGRRVCGAAGIDGTPCTLASNHPSGRCRYHGGHPRIGAPEGNQNARIHGLYSRRLKRCGDHCPLWNSCPIAGDDILDLDPRQRPVCPYEQDEYDAVIASLNRDSHHLFQPKPDPISLLSTMTRRDPEPTPTEPEINGDGPYLKEEPREEEHISLHGHLAHQVALLQVMMSRAAAALSVQPLVETTRASSDTYQLESSKMSPALYAFLRIAREYQRFVREYQRQGQESAAAAQAAEDARPGLADLMKPILKQADGVLEDALEYEKQRRIRVIRGEPLPEDLESDDENAEPMTPEEAREQLVADLTGPGAPVNALERLVAEAGVDRKAVTLRRAPTEEGAPSDRPDPTDPSDPTDAPGRGALCATEIGSGKTANVEVGPTEERECKPPGEAEPP